MLFIYFYNIINLLLTPIYILLILIRIFKKKDNLTSLRQRLGIIDHPRSVGEIIWIHAASVGESVAAAALIKTLSEKYPNINILLTTGTLSSGEIIGKSLPSNAFHQFVPIDNLISVRSFLNHFQPRLGIFIESELWPCLITEAAKATNLILVNARLSDRSYKRWQSKKRLFKAIIDNFKIVLVQSKTDFEKYLHLGCNNLINCGSLKFANKILEVDNEEASDLRALFADKKIFVAASTHKEDEEAVLQVIANIKTDDTLNFYPIVILRHPSRKDEISTLCKKLGITYSFRSENPIPVLKNDLFIVDSFGELGLFYELAHAVFIGGSFTMRHGGHNLLEPAYFNNIIILGPDMSNWQDITNEMIGQKCALQVQNIEELSQKIKFFFSGHSSDEAEKEGALYKQNALKYVTDRANILDNYLTQIQKYL